jgi:hypothetical protein
MEGIAMIRSARVLLVFATLALSACAAGYTATWVAPDASPLEIRGAKVAAVVMIKDQASRRRAEDTLAQEITARGAQGIAMYTLLPDAEPSMEAATRTALENAGVQGIVAMRPVNVAKELQITPVIQSSPFYRGYWGGGYYAYGWGMPWVEPMVIGSEISVQTVVSVETLVYSLKQNKLVWSGTSKTTNPPKVHSFVKKLAADAAKELEKNGLIRR